MKKTRDTTALVKDLELQIDYLIGYAPSGLHWKQEYHLRKSLIDDTLLSAPLEIVEKIGRIQDSLARLVNGEKHEQKYIKESVKEYGRKHEIRVSKYGKPYYSFMLEDVNPLLTK